MSGADEYIVWTTGTNGNFTGYATGVVSGSSYTLESLETSFNEDLNGDHTIGPVETTIASNGTTSLVQVPNQYALDNSGGSGPFVMYQGAPVTTGEFGGWTPVGAEQTATGYDVAWKMSGADEYIVWTTDANGNFTGYATGTVPGEDFALEDLETSFNENLNGEGRVSAVVDNGTSGGDTLNLTGQTLTATINLDGNTASASAGLSAPALTFIGTPDTITLGSAAATIQYVLEPSSGIETIANFVYGQDLLNIDLLGAAPSTLQTYDTTVAGQHAIAIASSADPAHGIVLLNMPTTDSAANWLTNHTTFSGGHALVS